MTIQTKLQMELMPQSSSADPKSSTSSSAGASGKANKADMKAMGALKADFKAVCDEVRASLNDRFLNIEFVGR